MHVMLTPPRRYQHSRQLVSALNSFADPHADMPGEWEKKLNRQGKVQLSNTPHPLIFLYFFFFILYSFFFIFLPTLRHLLFLPPCLVISYVLYSSRSVSSGVLHRPHPPHNVIHRPPAPATQSGVYVHHHFGPAHLPEGAVLPRGRGGTWGRGLMACSLMHTLFTLPTVCMPFVHPSPPPLSLCSQHCGRITRQSSPPRSPPLPPPPLPSPLPRPSAPHPATKPLLPTSSVRQHKQIITLSRISVQLGSCIA